MRFLAQQGIRQFIDLGSGFPTPPNVHEVARTIHPGARVAYVDHDPVVVAHGRAMHTADGAAVACADFRDADNIFNSPVVGELVDFSEPVGVLAVAVLHFLDDHASVVAVSRLRRAMAAGSYLVVSHASPGTRADVDDAAAAYRKTTAPIWVRTPHQIRCHFAGWELVEPGLVPVQECRPDVASADGGRRGQGSKDGSPRAVFLGGVARVAGAGDA